MMFQIISRFNEFVKLRGITKNRWFKKVNVHIRQFILEPTQKTALEFNISSTRHFPVFVYRRDNLGSNTSRGVLSLYPHLSSLKDVDSVAGSLTNLDWPSPDSELALLCHSLLTQNWPLKDVIRVIISLVETCGQRFHSMIIFFVTALDFQVFENLFVW